MSEIQNDEWQDEPDLPKPANIDLQGVDTWTKVIKKTKKHAKIVSFNVPHGNKEAEDKRAEYLAIKAKVDAPRDSIGIKVINSLPDFRSFNKYASQPYNKLNDTRKKENKYRKALGLKKNKAPINNLDNRFKANVDPRYLDQALKMQQNYHQRQKHVVMKEIKSTT